MSARKYGIVVLFTGLTTTTILACNWQYTRYRDATRRWHTLMHQIDTFEPVRVDIAALPFAKARSPDEWDCKLVRVDAHDVGDVEYVSRFREGRYGYVVVAPLKDAAGNGVFVSYGWIPQDMKPDDTTAGGGSGDGKLHAAQSEQSGVFDAKTLPKGVYGVVRRAEVKDYLHATYDKAALQGYQNYADLRTFAQKQGLKNEDDAAQFFVERIVKDSDADTEALYPVVPTEKTFARPYLTPHKHLEYATFWGSCTAIGLFTIQYVLRKW